MVDVFDGWVGVVVVCFGSLTSSQLFRALSRLYQRVGEVSNESCYTTSSSSIRLCMPNQ